MDDARAADADDGCEQQLIFLALADEIAKHLDQPLDGVIALARQFQLRFAAKVPEQAGALAC